MTNRAPAVPTMDLIHITIFLTRYPNLFNLTTWPPVLTWLLFISLTDQRLWNIVVVTTFTSCSSSSMSQNTIELVDSFLIQIFPCQQLRKKRQLFSCWQQHPLSLRVQLPLLTWRLPLSGRSLRWPTVFSLHHYSLIIAWYAWCVSRSNIPMSGFDCKSF